MDKMSDAGQLVHFPCRRLHSLPLADVSFAVCMSGGAFELQISP